MFKLGENKLGEDTLSGDETPMVFADIKTEIKKESSSLDTIGSFMIAYTFFYTFMKELFKYSGNYMKLSQNQKELLVKDLTNNSNCFSFSQGLIYHLSISNLTHREYSNIKKINLFRNKIAHDLFQYNIHSLEFKKELKEKTLDLIKYSNKFQELYIKRLEEISN